MPASATHLFTVDVEEYFQVKALESVVSRDTWLSRPSRVRQSVDTLLESLERHGARGTFFVLGWIADHRPDVVRAIHDAGHEVASHGYWHERVNTLSRRAFREDLRRAKDALEQVAGAAVSGYRAPNFSIITGCEWAFDDLIGEGFRYDSSLFPIVRRGYGYPTAPRVPHVITREGGQLAEYPLATRRVMGMSIPAAGGGYLRHFPFALIRGAFRHASASGEAATFYIHPWEIDHEQPRLPVSPLTAIRHYRGTATALSRIECLLGEHRFSAIRDHLPALLGDESPASVAVAS